MSLDRIPAIPPRTIGINPNSTIPQEVFVHHIVPNLNPVQDYRLRRYGLIRTPTELVTLLNQQILRSVCVITTDAGMDTYSIHATATLDSEGRLAFVVDGSTNTADLYIRLVKREPEAVYLTFIGELFTFTLLLYAGESRRTGTTLDVLTFHIALATLVVQPGYFAAYKLDPTTWQLAGRVTFTDPLVRNIPRERWNQLSRSRDEDVLPVQFASVERQTRALVEPALAQPTSGSDLVDIYIYSSL